MRFFRVHDNIIIIIYPSETYRRPIGDVCMLHWRPRHASPETKMHDRRPIGSRYATWETGMSDWRPINDLNMLSWRLTCLITDPSKTSTCYIGEQHAWLETHQRQTCPIRNWHFPSETNMPDKIPIRDLDMLLLSGKSVSNGSPIGLR